MKVLPTIYNGVTYRSRTEARWARFLDELGVAFEYEAESFNLDGSWYLPDFWVPAWNLYIEVKGEIPTPFERERCERLAQHTGRNVLLVAGAPGRYVGEFHIHTDIGLCAVPARIADCRRCDGLVIEYGGTEHCNVSGVILLGAHKDWERCGEKMTGGLEPEMATAAARNERFGVYPEPVV